MGFDPVKESVFAGETKAVFLAQDLSPKTAARVKLFCKDFADCFEIPFTMDELSVITQKQTGVMGVADENLAALCKTKLVGKKEEYNGN